MVDISFQTKHQRTTLVYRARPSDRARSRHRRDRAHGNRSDAKCGRGARYAGPRWRRTAIYRPFKQGKEVKEVDTSGTRRGRALSRAVDESRFISHLGDDPGHGTGHSPRGPTTGNGQAWPPN